MNSKLIPPLYSIRYCLFVTEGIEKEKKRKEWNEKIKKGIELRAVMEVKNEQSEPEV